MISRRGLKMTFSGVAALAVALTLLSCAPKTVEVTREVTKEVPVEVTRLVEVTKEVPVEVTVVVTPAPPAPVKPAPQRNDSPTWPMVKGRRPANMDIMGEITVPGDFQEHQFSEPTICQACHPEIYEQWHGTMHSVSSLDPVLRAVVGFTLQGATEDWQREEAELCPRCHAPIGHTSGVIPTSKEVNDANLGKLGERAGISCDFCHFVKASTGIGNAPYILDPGQGGGDLGTKRGPLTDAVSPGHKTEFSELHTRSEFCGMCHDVTHAVTDAPIERTYTEWREGPYNTGDPQTSVQCQDCHMRQRPGVPATGKTERPDNPGQVCTTGPKREHVWVHYIVGGSVAVPTLLGNKTHAALAEERLKNAADLAIIAEDLARGKLGTITVEVVNSGAGHYLPTGLTEVRQMWLAVTVKDDKGNLVFSSGAVDEEGNIDPQAVIYNTVLGDAEGNPTLNVAQATRVLKDYRIPPKGKREERYSFQVPEGAVYLDITATLRYRSAPQDVVNLLLGEGAPVLPITDMVTATKRVELK